MEAIEAIMTRRSIRRFTDQPVTDSELETVIRAAMAAPSAGNEQSWRFVVVGDQDVLGRLSQASPFATPLRGAPVGIVVCAETEGLVHPDFWMDDCPAATENLLLAAHAGGLGGVWIGVFPHPLLIDNFRRVIEAPEHIVPVAAVALGHPAEEKPAVDRYRPEFVHRDRW